MGSGSGLWGYPRGLVGDPEVESDSIGVMSLFESLHEDAGLVLGGAPSHGVRASDELIVRWAQAVVLGAEHSGMLVGGEDQRCHGAP